MSELKRPGKTMAIAGPTALAIVTVSYMLVNVAYFAAVPRDEIVSSGVTDRRPILFERQMSQGKV